MLQRFLPTTATSSRMHYQIFRNKHSSEADFQLIHQLYARVVSEDKLLCELSQKNLGRKVFVNGQMHPRLEKGPLFFQGVVRKVVREWVGREKEVKREIWPARQRVVGGAKDAVSEEDERLCEGLACGEGRGKIEW
jgi:hypothetical protein